MVRGLKDVHVNALQRDVLVALADSPEPLYEGEIKTVLNRSWSLLPSLRALWRRRLVARADYWSWQITDDGLVELGRKPRRPTLTVIVGGVANSQPRPEE